jgi:hypothetical protein
MTWEMGGRNVDIDGLAGLVILIVRPTYPLFRVYFVSPWPSLAGILQSYTNTPISY